MSKAQEALTCLDIEKGSIWTEHAEGYTIIRGIRPWDSVLGSVIFRGIGQFVNDLPIYLGLPVGQSRLLLDSICLQELMTDVQCA